MDDIERAKLLEGVEPSEGLLEWADQVIKDLQAIEIQRQTQIESMCDQLVNLWKRLGADVEDMEGFMEQNKGVTEDCVRAYEEELERMVKEKRAKMEDFVQSARHEIEVLWNELVISQAERNEFLPFKDGRLLHSITTDVSNSNLLILEYFTEDLLTVHEEEIRRLKEERELKALLLGKIKKYFDICDDEKKLEISASDQGRLTGKSTSTTKRDPGRLLKEEKMRNRVTREKPKVCFHFL